VDIGPLGEREHLVDERLPGERPRLLAVQGEEPLNAVRLGQAGHRGARRCRRLLGGRLLGRRHLGHEPYGGGRDHRALAFVLAGSGKIVVVVEPERHVRR